MAVAYYVLVGAPLILLQAAVNGTTFDSYGAFLLYLLASLAKDCMRLLPLIMFRNTRFDLLHPLVLMVTIWPIIKEMPLLESSLTPLVGLLIGEPVDVLEFLGSEFRSTTEVFLVMAKLEILEALGLLILIAVFTACSRHFHADPRSTQPLPAPVYAPERIKLILIGAIVVSTAIVYAFVQYRGGLTAHMASLALGRAVALEGVGPVSAISRVSLLALFVWVCFRPNAVREPWFIPALLLAAFNVFVFSAARGETMIAIIGAGLCWSLRTGRIPVRAAAIAAPLLLLAYGAMLIIRAGTYSDERAGLSVWDRLSSMQYKDAYVAGSGEASSRASLRGAAPVMLDGYTMSGGPLLGSSYIPIFTWFIPRPIWSDKPRGVGSTYAQLFLGAESNGAAVPIGIVAEAYWNFWIPGVFLIFGVTGLAIFWAHHVFLRYGANPFIAAAFARFIMNFAVNAEAIVPLFHALAILLGLWLLARLFAQERGPKSPLVSTLQRT